MAHDQAHRQRRRSEGGHQTWPCVACDQTQVCLFFSNADAFCFFFLPDYSLWNSRVS